MIVLLSLLEAAATVALACYGPVARLPHIQPEDGLLASTCIANKPTLAKAKGLLQGNRQQIESELEDQASQPYFAARQGGLALQARNPPKKHDPQVLTDAPRALLATISSVGYPVFAANPPYLAVRCVG
jgi:hypothetical protein